MQVQVERSTRCPVFVVISMFWLEKEWGRCTEKRRAEEWGLRSFFPLSFFFFFFEFHYHWQRIESCSDLRFVFYARGKNVCVCSVPSRGQRFAESKLKRASKLLLFACPVRSYLFHFARSTTHGKSDVSRSREAGARVSGR